MDDWEDIMHEAGEANSSDDVEDDGGVHLYHTHDDNAPGQTSDDAIDDKQQLEDKATTPSQEEQTCRICFAGVEEEPDLGRLISPCLCRGSMSKVHIACLNSWRNVAQGSSSFFQCDQCRYRYRVKRAKIAGLAESRVALVSLAGLFFSLLVLLNGFLGNWLLNSARSPDSFISTLFFDGPYADDYSYSGMSYRDSYLPFEAVGQAVDFAQKVVKDKIVGPADDEADYDDSVRKIKAKQPQHDKWDTVRIEHRSNDGSTSYRLYKPKKLATTKKQRLAQQARKQRNRFIVAFRKSISFLAVGISMTGIGSFLWMILTLPLWPLHPLRTSLFRSFRGTRDSRGGFSPMGTVLIILFVVVGLVKSVHMCWKLTNKTAKFLLKRAETGILEVRQ